MIKARGAAARQALAETVPIVDTFETRRVGLDEHAQVAFAVVRGDVDPVRVERAGGVVLLSVEMPRAVGLRETQAVVGDGGAFGHGAADDLPLRDAREPAVAQRVVAIFQQ